MARNDANPPTDAFRDAQRVKEVVVTTEQLIARSEQQLRESRSALHHADRVLERSRGM